jgi:hypothetical protein
MADENKKEEIKEEEKSGEVEKKKKMETAAKAPKDDAPQADEKPLDKMTVPELKEIARTIPGVTGATSMKKAELLELIKEHRGIKDEEPVKQKKKKVGEKEITVKDLKAKVFQLKGEKKEALEAQDKKKVDILRRRINRLKKQTRKVAQA